MVSDSWECLMIQRGLREEEPLRARAELPCMWHAQTTMYQCSRTSENIRAQKKGGLNSFIIIYSYFTCKRSRCCCSQRPCLCTCILETRLRLFSPGQLRSPGHMKFTSKFQQVTTYRCWKLWKEMFPFRVSCMQNLFYKKGLKNQGNFCCRVTAKIKFGAQVSPHHRNKCIPSSCRSLCLFAAAWKSCPYQLRIHWTTAKRSEMISLFWGFSVDSITVSILSLSLSQ